MYCMDSPTYRMEVVLMPTYNYKCKTCGASEIIAHGFHDDEQHDCFVDTCNGTMRKVISATPTHFKTGGFYSTDNRK